MANSREYKSVELISTKDGAKLEYRFGKRGETLAAVKKLTAARAARVIFDTQAKNCLANLVPGLTEAVTIVHIPKMTEDGKPIDPVDWQWLLWAAASEFGVPTYTQSSAKSQTFYFIQTEVWMKLASVWEPEKDGEKFAAYVGLLFSEMTSEPVTVPVKIVEPQHGQDGNHYCPMGFLPPIDGEDHAQQFRAMILPQDGGVPLMLGKGVLVPHGEQAAVELDTNQIKFSAPALGDLVGRTVMLTFLFNENVSSKPIRQWYSWEGLAFLDETPELFEFLAEKVRDEVRWRLSMLTEEGKVELLKRLGELRLDPTGKLLAARRAVGDMIRSALPWGKQQEDRIVRFMINELTQKVIPSGGLWGWANLIVMDDERGARQVDRAPAKAGGFRMPKSGALAEAFLSKNPHKRGRGYVVHSAVAKAMDGDGDGDRMVLHSSEVQKIINKHLMRSFPVSGKPAKFRAESPLTAERLEDLALRQQETAWLMGGLTLYGLKALILARANDDLQMLQMSGRFFEMANASPMLLKWDIAYDGLPLAEAARMMIAEAPEELRDYTPAFRQRMQEAKSWKSIRELADSHIDEPICLMDRLWNVAAEEAALWVHDNPSKLIALSTIARKVFSEGGIITPGFAARERRKITDTWGEYWAAHRDQDGNVIPGDHSLIFQKITEMGKAASKEALKDLAAWRPSSGKSDGFTVKFHAIFAAGRGVEVFGLHPDIAAWLEDQQAGYRIEEAAGKIADLLR